MATAQQLRRLALSISRGDEVASREALKDIANYAEGTGRRRLATDLDRILNTPTTDATGRLRVGHGGITQPSSIPPFCVDVPVHRSDELTFVPPTSVAAALDRIVLENEKINLLAHNDLSPMRKVLLVGPPGTGKTLSARVLAHRLNLKLYRVSSASMFSRYLGESAKHLAQLFSFMAEQRAVYLFDEFDSFARSRQIAGDVGEMTRFTNELLQLIELEQSHSLIVAATNLGQSLDEAFARRFERIVTYSVPDEGEINQLLAIYLPEVKAKTAAKPFLGLSQADAVAILTDLRKQLVLGLQQKLTLKSVKEAVRSYRNQLRVLSDEAHKNSSK